jgi:hypothetical protein
MSVRVAARVRPLLPTEDGSCPDALRVSADGQRVAVDLSVVEGFVARHEAFVRTNTAPLSGGQRADFGRRAAAVSPSSVRSLSPPVTASGAYDVNALRSARSIVRSTTPTHRSLPTGRSRGEQGTASAIARCPIFRFDQCFTPLASQQEVFDAAARPLVAKVMEGYSCCVIAYGQTGSGKTYTMLGPHEDELGGRGSYTARLRLRAPESRGIILRCAEELLLRVREQQLQLSAAPCTSHREQIATALTHQPVVFEVSMNCVQVFREKVWCLLGDGQRAVRPREIATGLLLEGALSVGISNMEDVELVVNEAIARRLRGSAFQNAQSSRSHALLSIQVRCVRSSTARSFESTLQLVDLAGSERVGRNHNSAAGADQQAFPLLGQGVSPRSALPPRPARSIAHLLEEGSDINQSLTALGKVIHSLAAKEAHVPYRDSILTFLLKNSFGGNAHTTMVATVSPSVASLEESLSTLRYCAKAREIVNTPSICSADLAMKVVEVLENEVSDLRQQLGRVSASALAAEVQADLLAKEALLAKYQEEAARTAQLRQEWEEERQLLTEKVRQLEVDAVELRAELKHAREAADKYNERIEQLAKGIGLSGEEPPLVVHRASDDIRAILKRTPTRATTCLPWPIAVSTSIPRRYEWILDSVPPPVSQPAATQPLPSSARNAVALPTSGTPKSPTSPAGSPKKDPSKNFPGPQRDEQASSSSEDDLDVLSPAQLRAEAAKIGIDVASLLAAAKTPGSTNSNDMVRPGGVAKVPVLRFAQIRSHMPTHSGLRSALSQSSEKRQRSALRPPSPKAARAAPSVQTAATTSSRPPLVPSSAVSQNSAVPPRSAPAFVVLGADATVQSGPLNPAVQDFRQKLRNQTAPSLVPRSRACLDQTMQCLGKTLDQIERIGP